MTIDNKKIFEEFSLLAQKNNSIDPSLYTKFNVKRGLRNNDGTGVLVGLTEIGEVHGYILDEGDKMPDEGRLAYRGIDVRDIVKGFQNEKRYGFEETCYLLLFGELPNKKELEQFEELINEKRTLPNGFTEDMILKAPSRDIMNKLARSVLASYSYAEEPDDTSISNVLEQCIELIARFPTMVAYGYQAKAHYFDNESLRIHNPQSELSTAENFLYMVRPESEYTRTETELLDLALVLHAEHGGGNNSAFAIHVVSSSGTDSYSAIAAAVGSLKGAKHGGASIKVKQMVDDIKANVKDWENESEVRDYLVKIVAKEAFDRSGLIYGMGHAVYTKSDPRAILLKEKARVLAKEKNKENEFNLYTFIENLTPEVFYEVKKSEKIIGANVDLYSGFVYSMMDIPSELYTPIFAMSRIAGWCAHLIEQNATGGRIIRPAYKSVVTKQAYTPLNQR